MADLGPVDLVLQHPAHGRLGEEHPQQDEHVDEVRHKRPQVAQQRHFLQQAATPNTELPLVRSSRPRTTVAGLTRPNHCAQANIFADAVRLVDVTHR